MRAKDFSDDFRSRIPISSSVLLPHAEDLRPGHRPHDGHDACLNIDVAPFQSAQLAQAYARVKAQQHSECPFVFKAQRRAFYEPLLCPGENLNRYVPHFRQLYSFKDSRIIVGGLEDFSESCS